MNKRIIIEKQEEYIGVVNNLKRLRPACHAVSAVSTICFCIVWITSFAFAQKFIANNYVLSYVIASVVSITGALYFEKIVSGVIDAFATIFTDGHGWKAVTGISLVLLPIFFVAASTSFVGFKNTIAGNAAGESVEFLSEFTQTLNKDNQKSLKLMHQDEIRLRSDRKKSREAIEKKWNAKIKSARIECAKVYNEYKTNGWHKTKLQECQIEKQSEFESALADELLNFDKETENKLKGLSEKNSSIGKGALDANGEALSAITSLETESVSRINWLGGFFGFAAVVALFVSLFAAVIEKKISNVLVKKLNSHSPTLSSGGKGGVKSTEKAQTRPIFVDRGGVKSIEDDFAEVERLNRLRLDPDNPNAYEDTMRMHELVEAINKKGYGIYFSRDERKVTLKKTANV